MDEPLSSLDRARKREILPHIESLPERFGVPILYVTHNVDEVVRLANDVVLLAGGRVAAHGRVAEVFERLDLAPLAEGLEPGAVLRGSVVAYDSGVATLRVGTQDLRIPMGETPVGAQHSLRVLASDVAIATARPERLSIRNVLDARILHIETSTGPNVEVLLAIDGQRLRSRITREASAELGLTEGRHVFALIKSVALESSLSP
jgi:molybdate transport system ATP-binding protein